jgi:sugar phosphate isomerase/epimerase
MRTRRHFLQHAVTAAGAIGFVSLRGEPVRPARHSIEFGLCTYMWGAEWDLDTIIAHCARLGVRGVELRVEHAHRVSPALSSAQRAEVRAKFSEGKVTFVGMGTNAQFDSPDPAKLAANLDLAKQYLKLSHDLGGSGVKVKPNNLHVKEGIPKERTLAQIGKALAELGGFARGLGQEVRLEVHGEVSDLVDIQRVMEVAATDNVRVCWNSNAADLNGQGIEKNFARVRNYLGHTTHVHELDDPRYPYDKLAKLLVEANYEGWVLLEAATKVEDKAKALAAQKALWEKLLAAARAG